jgi:hypothetical protein
MYPFLLARMCKINRSSASQEHVDHESIQSSVNETPSEGSNEKAVPVTEQPLRHP